MVLSFVILEIFSEFLSLCQALQLQTRHCVFQDGTLRLADKCLHKKQLQYNVTST